MRKSRKIILIAALLVAGAAFIYWQLNKKTIIRQALQNAVSKGSDSVYTISYDSSVVDEIAGNVTFFNLRLQSDSLFTLLKNDSAAFRSGITSVYVKRVHIRGANIPGLLSNNTIQANEIIIEEPSVLVILPPESKADLSREDSLQLYERLTGKFNSIKASRISVSNGNVQIANGTSPAHIKVNGINLRVNDLLIDSSNNHQTLLNYFIQDLVAAVDSATLLKKAGGSVMMAGIAYSAPGKFLTVQNFSESNGNAQTSISEISNTRFVNLSTDAFINRKEIRADSLLSSGGKLRIDFRSGEKDRDITKQINISNEYFNKVHIRNILWGKTDVTLYNEAKKRMAAQIKGLTFAASGIDEMNFTFNIPWVLNNSNWIIEGERIELPDFGNYKAQIGKFSLDKPAASASLTSVRITPTVSDEVFMQQQKQQKDLYRINLSGIVLSNVKFSALLKEQSLLADEAVIQPDLYIYNDRTLPQDTSSKVGNYPQQMLKRLSIPVYIKKMNLKNGKVNYRERGAISKKTGDVVFTKINGSITQLSNMNNMIGRNSEMVLDAKAMFLGIAPLHTTWRFPMNKNDGSFFITSEIGEADARRFTTVIEPLGMAQIKKGKLKGLKLNMKGDDYGSAGSTTVLYNDLKIIYLEEPKGSDTINRKNLLTFFANIFTKSDNPSNGKVRSNSVGIARDTTRSFFNLVWKSIFEGVKKTASGKSM